MNFLFYIDQIFDSKTPKRDGIEVFLTGLWNIMLFLWSTLPVHLYIFIEKGGSVGDVWNFKNPFLKLTGILGVSAIYSTACLAAFLFISALLIYTNSVTKWLQKLNW